MMSIEGMIDLGGEAWGEVAETICVQLGEIMGDHSTHLEAIRTADTMDKRMWYLGIAFYVLDVDLGDALTGPTRYFMDHFYEFAVYTIYQNADVYTNMSALRDQMNEHMSYNDLDGPLGEDPGGDADL